jgi:Holliday junction DNA helicase RuvA
VIASLSGKVAEIALGTIVIDVSGVGYLVTVPASTASKLRVGEPVRVLTHMVVREDSLALYGFADADEREVFQALIGVNGVGPKLAVAVLSHLRPDALRRAVASGDVASLTGVPGVGTRSAQRMIMELKQRFGDLGIDGVGFGGNLGEVREALLVLGYAPAEVAPVLAGVSAKDAPVEEMVKAALKALSRA